MATLLLVREASLPSGAVAAAARFDGTHAVGACTAGGHLLYLPARPADARTPAGSSFSILLQHPAEAEAQPLEKLVRPWALLAFLPRGEGVLFAQEGSRKLLFAPLPAEPGAGSSSSVFLFGSHEADVSCLAVSPSGVLALSGDSAGELRLWGLGYGALLAAAPGAHASRVMDACFLGDGAAVSAEADGSVRAWSTAGSSLQMVGELVVGGGRQPCRLVGDSSGSLLAVGCSDGSVLVWRCNGERDFAPCCKLQLPGPVADLCFGATGSGSSPLLASAAGSTVAVQAVPTGELFLRQELAGGAAVAACCIAEESVVVCTSSAQLASLPIPTVAPSEQQELQQLAQPPAAAQLRQRPPTKKAVRFADAVASVAAGSPAKAATFSRVGESPSPAPSAAGRFGREALPPLPSNPFWHRRVPGPHVEGGWSAPAASSCAGAAPPFAPRSEASQSSGETPAPAGAPPPLAAAAAAALGTAPQHSGGQAVAAAADAGIRVIHAPAVVTVAQRHTATTTEPDGPDMTAWQWQPVARRIPPLPQEVEEEEQETMTRQPTQRQPMQQQPAGQPAPPPAAANPGGGEQDEEQPRAVALPAPLQRQHQGPAASRPSSRQFSACGLAGSPRAGGKAAKAASMATPTSEAGSGAVGREGEPAASICSSGAGASRPCSPIKVGTNCTRQAQQEGRLLPPEIKQVMVEEADMGSAHSEWRRQRYARLSRRCRISAQQQREEEQWQQQECVNPQGGQKEGAGRIDGASQQEEQRGQEPGREAGQLLQQGSAGQSAEDPSEGERGPLSSGLPGMQQDPQQHEAPPAGGQAEVASGGEARDSAGEWRDTAGFAVESDEELEEEGAVPVARGDEAGPAVASQPAEPGAAGAAGPGEARHAGLVSDAADVGPRPPVLAGADAVAWAGRVGRAPAQAVDLQFAPPVCSQGAGHAPQPDRPRPARTSGATPSSASTGSTNQLQQVQRQLAQLGSSLAGLASRSLLRQQQAAEGEGRTGLPLAPGLKGPAGGAGSATLPQCQEHPQQWTEQQQTGAPLPMAPNIESTPPASRLAVPQVNSGLLLLQRRQQLEQQIANPSAAVSPERLREIQVQAATESTTLPPHARLFPAGPPVATASPPKPPPKALHPKWVAEQQLKPVLEDLWRRKERLPPACHTAFPRPVAVPLPDSRGVLLELLGMRGWCQRAVCPGPPASM